MTPSKDKTVIAFVTELMRAVKNTDLNGPIQFAAFRQVAEEKLEAFVNSKVEDIASKAFAAGRSKMSYEEFLKDPQIKQSTK